MAVYGNTLSNNLIAIDYVVQEGNQLLKLFDSMQCLNENGIILEAEEKAPTFLKVVGERIVNFLTKLKNAIASFFNKIKQKVRSAIGPSSKVTIADLEVIDVKGYVEKWNAIDDKYKLADDMKRLIKGVEVFEDEMEKAIEENAQPAIKEVEELLDSMKEPEVVTIANKKASDILNELDSLNIKKVLNSINNTITNCHSLTVGSTMMQKAEKARGSVNSLFNGGVYDKSREYFAAVAKYYTISSNVWKEIQQDVTKVYAAVIQYVKSNKGGSKPAEETK